MNTQENTDRDSVEFADLFADLVEKHGEENGGSEDFFVHNENRIGCRYADLSMHRNDYGWHYGNLPESYPTPAECYDHWREDVARVYSANVIGMARRCDAEKDQTPSSASPSPPCSGFFIVDIHDRPSEAHIAEKREDGKFYYVHPALRHDKRFWGMTPSNPTPIEAFGMMVDVKARIFVGVRDDTAPVTATYLDGRGRRWQGSRTFSFPFQNAQIQP